MSTSMWLPLTRSDIGHDVPLARLVEAYLDVSISLALYAAANVSGRDREHPRKGAELAELALAAAIENRVSTGRGVGIRAAREAGASWDEIALALGEWAAEKVREEFSEWIDGQAWLYAREGFGLDPEQEAAARRLLS